MDTGKHTKRPLVIGAVLQPFLVNIYASITSSILHSFMVEKVDQEAWYPQQLLVKLYKAVETLRDGKDISVAVGMKSLDFVDFGEDVTTIPEALNQLNDVYHQIHRHIPDVEGWTIIKDQPRRYRAILKSPYSDFAAYGYLYAILRHYRFDHVNFSVVPNTEHSQPTVFQLTWKDAPS